MTYKKPASERKSDAAGLRRLREYERQAEAWISRNAGASREQVREAMDAIMKRLCA